MKAITLREPWASALFVDEAPKLVENRTWGTAYRGDLAIVVSLTVDTTPEADAAWARIGDAPARPGAGIIGVVELLDIHQQFSERCHCVLMAHGGWALCTPLAAPRAMQHWMLGNPRPLSATRTFPYTGFLGIAELGKPVTGALLDAVA